MLKHVLIPLDGSLFAEKAIDHARHILASDGKITLITSIQTPTPPLYAYPSPDVLEEVDHDLEYMKNAQPHAHGYLDKLAKNLQLNGYHVEIEIQSGDAADKIIELAETLHPDAIVMSTHGRSGLSRWLFGSVTQKVLGATPCPVYIIPNRERVPVEETATTPPLNPSLA